ncbi:hypothetical protein [Psychroserpens luteus]|uniref:Uncharacterized protein n=1 Tax=Psychroserpens luteus TaxID=1434066 RepID=A0ABW5ZXI5_9FLAO|nr:hypothetical protein [Psychroserpens luteus]
MVLTLQDDGTYNTAIVAYHFPDFNNIGIGRQEIDFDSDTIFDNMTSRVCIGWYSCTSWNYCECEEDPTCGAYSYDQVCTDDNQVEFAEAEESGSGTTTGSTSGNGSTSSGTTGENDVTQWDGTVWTSGGGGNGDTDTDDTNTGGSTTTSSPFILTPKTPCEKMNKLKADTGFRAKMVELKTAADDENVENTFTLYNKTGLAPLTDKYLYAPKNGTPSQPKVTYNYFASTQGFIRSHYNGLLSTISVKDLQDMYITMLQIMVRTR